MERLILVWLLTAVIHLIMTFSFAIRLAGVRTHRLAIAFSLYNVIFLGVNTANAIQGPLLAKLVEETINTAPVYQAEHMAALGWDIRSVLLAASLGTLLGVLLTPSFVRLFTYGILLFERIGSVPRLLLAMLHPMNLLKIARSLHLPRMEQARALTSFRSLRQRNIPWGFLIVNVFIAALWTTGVLSALYAGALVPAYRTTASTLSAVINGGATVLQALLVDPTSAMLTDQAIQGKRDEGDIRDMVQYLAVGRFIGTILSQFLLVPGAELVAFITQLL